MILEKLRSAYHKSICANAACLKKDIPNIADIDNKTSVKLAQKIFAKINFPLCNKEISGQTAGARFGEITKVFLNDAFKLLLHLRPGDWFFSASQAGAGITAFEQYRHLAEIDRLIKEYRELKLNFGGDYLIIPDIVIGRMPVSDSEINKKEKIVSEKVARLTPLREKNYSDPAPLLHASISCKWTIRSDRSQNTRTEALNLIRNRKGKTPHIAAVTAEPLPTRIASLAMGTGDIDCVYHFALFELRDAIKEIGNDDQDDMLETLINGKRLRDISDLPLDLVS